MFIIRKYHGHLMQCPHCLIGIRETWKSTPFLNDHGEYWEVSHMRCSECMEIIIELSGHKNDGTEIMKQRIYPKQISRTAIPSDVEKEFADDYAEACLVLNDSPKASAALSRRCLQNILRRKAGITEKDLHTEIEKAISGNVFPSHISDVLDAVRHFGNFGAHPITDIQTGSIIDVESGEAEWILDIIEELFDFYYVQPKRIRARKDELNKKLKSAGKKLMKT